MLNATNVDLRDFEIGWVSGGARDPIVPGVQRLQSFAHVLPCKNSRTGGVLSTDLPLNGEMPLGSVSVWNDELGWPWQQSAPDAFEVYFPKNAQSTFLEGKSECLPLLQSLIGRRVLLRHIVFSNHALHCLGCVNVTMDNIRITSAPGMGFVFERGGENLTLRNDVVAPECSPHCNRPEPSLTADAAHFAGVAGKITLEGNDFGWQGDDGVNITGLMIPAQIDRDSSGTFLTVIDQWRGRLSEISVGKKVLLYDRGLSRVAECEATSVSPSEGRITLSKMPMNLREVIIARADGIPANVVIRNNRFHDNRARGIL